MKTPEERTASERFHSFMRGFRCGATATAKDERFTRHERGDIREAWAAGLEAGRGARAAAVAHAMGKYGYEPSVLRTREGIDGPV